MTAASPAPAALHRVQVGPRAMQGAGGFGPGQKTPGTVGSSIIHG